MAKKNLPYPAEKIGELLIEVDNEVAKKSDLNDFVKKESGRGLSTNDYTTTEKAKLASIQEGAQKNAVTSVRGALQLNPQVGNVVISAADIGLGNANTRLTSLENNKLDKSEKGATNGVASLDENGRVPSSQLPSYVDDVIDDLNFAQFPATGETGKIYIAKDTNKTYRWSGNGYAEVSASLALGETEQTAYSGAKGKKNAEDIAKLADDLEETHLLAGNAESAISEVVELTIPTIESEVANKATKSEAQGYATTAKSEAIAAAATDAQNKANTAESNAKTYADGKVKGLADGQVATNTTAIASLQTAQASTAATVKSQGTTLSTHTQQIANLDSNKLGKTEKAADSAKADYATSAGSATNATNASQLNGTSVVNKWDGVNKGIPRFLSDGVMGIGRVIDFHIASEPSEIYFATRLRCQEKVTGATVYLPATSGTLALTTDTVANAEKLGGVAAADYMQKSGGTFTGNITAPKFIGALQGNADSATKLATARKIWGQRFDGTGDVKGNIIILFDGNSADTYKISFAGDIEPRGPYIKAVGYGGYGRKKWQLFQHTEAAYPSSYANHTLALEVDVNGNVGIGKTNPSEKLDVNGNAKVRGNVSAINGDFSGTLSVGGNATINGTMTATATYHSSDERLKTFEGDVEVDLEKLKALPKKYFHWTADADGKRQLGTSAQAVEKIFPELVSTDVNDFKSVNYANLSIVALAAIDKLAEKNDKLAEQNTELSKKNAELERRLAKIEKLLNIE